MHGTDFILLLTKINLKLDWDRDRLIYEINKKGVPAFTGSCSEIYLEKCFKNYWSNSFKRLKIAITLAKQVYAF